MSQRIFVLDDDENSCQLAENVLSKAGYQVMTRTQGIGSTVAIKSFHPDLVLLDVMMPALSGDSLAEIISMTLKPRPKVLYYSNKSAHELKDLVARTGVDGYICKVDGPTALLRTVRSQLGA